MVDPICFRNGTNWAPSVMKSVAASVPDIDVASKNERTAISREIGTISNDAEDFPVSDCRAGTPSGEVLR